MFVFCLFTKEIILTNIHGSTHTLLPRPIKIPRSATNTATSNHFTFLGEEKQKHLRRSDMQMLMIEENLCKFDMSVENGWYVDRHHTVIPLPTTLVMVMHRRITVKSRLILVSNTFATRKARPTGIIRRTSYSFSIPCVYLTLIGLKI